VIFTNNGPGSLSVAGFSFGVSVDDTDITLTGTSFSTVAYPYIFAGDSFDEISGFPIDDIGDVVITSSQELAGTDITNDGAGFVIGSGDSADLGEVLFSVADPAATGQFTVSFFGGIDPTIPPVVNPLSALNNLADPSGNGISVDSYTGGTISIASPVPEPPSFLLALSGMAIPLIAVFARKRLGQAV
jgi:hypothetical protein